MERAIPNFISAGLLMILLWLHRPIDGLSILYLCIIGLQIYNGVMFLAFEKIMVNFHRIQSKVRRVS